MIKDTTVREKWEHLKNGAAPRLLDLFSGCGGLSLGFVRAGCVSVGGIDSDHHAARSYALNFHRELPTERFERLAAPKDLSTWTAAALARECVLGDAGEAVDVLVGSPAALPSVRQNRPSEAPLCSS